MCPPPDPWSPCWLPTLVADARAVEHHVVAAGARLATWPATQRNATSVDKAIRYVVHAPAACNGYWKGLSDGISVHPRDAFDNLLDSCGDLCVVLAQMSFKDTQVQVGSCEYSPRAQDTTQVSLRSMLC